MTAGEPTFDVLVPVQTFAESLGVPWWIAGGWATDLFLGSITRPHGDVDLLVLDRNQDTLRLKWLEGSLERRHKGEAADWPSEDVLVAGPDLLQPTGGMVDGWKVDIMVGKTRGDSWVFHRGTRSVERPIAELGLIGPLGLPYLAPEVSLRTRARFSRENDELDFLAVAPRMSPTQRGWLRANLPADHRWAAELEKVV